MNLKIRLFLLLFVVSSCGTHFYIDPRGCQGVGQWGDKINDKRFTERYWDFTGLIEKEEIDLRDEFKNNNIDCENMREMSIIVKKTWWDATLSLIPFVSVKTIEFNTTGVN